MGHASKDAATTQGSHADVNISAFLPHLGEYSCLQICHASKDVATTLGYTVPQLMDDLSTRLWDVIIPQPFAQLHRVHVSVS